ncbi:MAG: glycosyltransferase [Proteobacteria bacterium]|nr:glycosyltransferase [Pseudomonadota bacterium]
MTIIVPHGFEPNYTLGFVKGLVAHNIDLCVISSDIDQLRLTKIGINNINLRGSQDHNRTFLSKAINIIKYYAYLLIYLLQNQRNVIHFTGLFGNSSILYDGIILNLFFKLVSSRYIYTVHNILPHSKQNSQLFRWIYRIIYIVPDILLVHTHLAKQQLVEKFHVPERKIIVISIGLNEEIPVTKITQNEAKKHLGFNSQDNIVLFFGKADTYKGLDILIEAFDQLNLPSMKLLIAGWFPDSSYRQQITSAINNADHRAAIYLHEAFIPNDEVEYYFKSADVLVLPYRNIYQSGVVFLCFNFGLPIVSTPVGSIPEFIGDDMGIITETNDPQGIADGLRHFFEAKDKFNREIIAAKAKKYKWENLCKALVPLYKERY